MKIKGVCMRLSQVSVSLFWTVTLAAPSPHMFRVSRRLNRMNHKTGSLSTKPA